MNALKRFWMGFWRLSLAFVVFVGFFYGIMMLVDTIDIRFTAIILFTLVFLFFSYAIGEVIAENREREEARKSAMAYFDEERRKDLANDSKN